MPALPQRPLPPITDLGHDHVWFAPVLVAKIRDRSALRRCGGGSMLGRMPDNEANEAMAGAGPLGSGYGDVLWEPSAEVVKRARITDYRRWLAERGVSIGGPAGQGGSAGEPPAPGTS